MDDADSGVEGFFAVGDGVNSVVLRRLGAPRLHAHGLREVFDEALELVRRDGHEVLTVVEAGQRADFARELVALEELEVDDRRDGFKVVRVLGDLGIQVMEAADRVEFG